MIHLTNITSLNIIKNILAQQNQKHVSGWCLKKHLHCTIYRSPKTELLEPLESKC